MRSNSNITSIKSNKLIVKVLFYTLFVLRLLSILKYNNLYLETSYYMIEIAKIT